MPSSHRLSAILFADITGYTAMMQRDEKLAAKLLYRFKNEVESKVEEFKGQIINFYGDGVLCVFDATEEAVRCSIELQKSFSDKPKVPVRIGIHNGTVVFDDKMAYGDSVNIASRIESLGIPGAVLISDAVRRDLKNQPDLKFQSVGKFEFKNIEEPMEVYALSNQGLPIPKREEMKGKLKLGKKTKSAQLIKGLVVLLLLLLAGQWAYNKYWNSGNVDVASIEKSIAVLPFKNMSENKENQHFCDGVMNAVHNHLSKIPDLRVISPTSVEKYRDNPISSKQIAEDLDVNYIVTGSVQRVRNQAIIMANLVHAGTDKTMWSEPYKRDVQDIFAVQAEVTQAIAVELQAAISPELERRIETIPTTEIEAYDLYNRGRNYQYRFSASGDQQDLDNAESLYNEALAIDSTFALAYVGLGLVNLSETGWGVRLAINQSEYVQRVGQLADKALEYDPTLAEAHYLRGLYSWNTSQPEKAITDMRKAISLNPNMASAYLELGGFIYYHQYDIPEAVFNYKNALSLERRGALTPWIFRALGAIYLHADDFEKAEEYFRECVRIDPGNFRGYVDLWWLLCVQGKFEESLVYREKMCEINPGSCFANMGATYSWMKDFKKALEYHEKYNALPENLETTHMGLPNLIYSYRKTGQVDRAKKLFQEYLKWWDQNEKTNFVHVKKAEGYAAIGDTTNAMIELQKYKFRPSAFYPWIIHAPSFEDLWEMEEFKTLVNRLEEEKAERRAELRALEAAGKL